MSQPRFQVMIAPHTHGWRWIPRYMWRYVTENNRTIATSLARFDTVEDCILAIKTFQASVMRARYIPQEVADGYRVIYRIGGESVAISSVRSARHMHKVMSTVKAHRVKMTAVDGPIRIQLKYRGKVK